MKKILLFIAVIAFLAPVSMASASAKATAGNSFISSLFGKKEKPQPKFRPQSKGVYKVK